MWLLEKKKLRKDGLGRKVQMRKVYGNKFYKLKEYETLKKIKINKIDFKADKQN